LWRIFQVTKHLSRDGHVWRKFGSGSRESLLKAAKDLKAKGQLDKTDVAPRSNGLTLSPVPSRLPSPSPSLASDSSELEEDGGSVGRETRRRLVEWWTKEYCASRMRLCVIGKGTYPCFCHSSCSHCCIQDSLDQLAKFVSALFSPILNRGQDPLPMIYDHPFGPQDKCVCFCLTIICQSSNTCIALVPCIHSDNHVFSFPRHIVSLGVSTITLEIQTGTFHCSSGRP